MSFLGEIKRRKIFQVAAVYLVVAWLIMQVVDVVSGPLLLPDMFARMIIVVLAIGFPVAVILSWAFDLTPEGVVRDQRDSASVKHGGRKIEFALVGLLVLAIGWIGFREFNPPASSAGLLPNSVAVLPFENMSVDPEEAFYASGIHEEILNQLVKLSALNVIARTSVQQYTNTEKSIPEIAEELNVETVMEGSVRYAGGQIRITAQLNDGVTGAHLWSETYTRDFEDIFAIESDVAVNVANAVGAEFSLGEQASIESVPTDSPDAYQYFLAALDTTGFENSRLRLEFLDRAIEADPNFASAYAERADTRLSTLTIDVESQVAFETEVEEIEQLALDDINRALAIDPEHSWAYLVEAEIHEINWSRDSAQEAFARAYELSPNDPVVLRQYAQFNSFIGNHEEAVRLAEQWIELDPVADLAPFGEILSRAGDVERSTEIFHDVLDTQPGNNIANRILAYYEAAIGNTAQARSHMEVNELNNLSRDNLTRIAGVAGHYANVGLIDEATRVLETFDQMKIGRRVPSIASFWEHVARGDAEQALYWLEQVAEEREPGYQGFGQIIELAQNQFRVPMLDQSEFVEVRSRLGFTE